MSDRQSHEPDNSPRERLSTPTRDPNRRRSERNIALRSFLKQVLLNNGLDVPESEITNTYQGNGWRMEVTDTSVPYAKLTISSISQRNYEIVRSAHQSGKVKVTITSRQKEETRHTDSFQTEMDIDSSVNSVLGDNHTARSITDQDKDELVPVYVPRSQILGFTKLEKELAHVKLELARNTDENRRLRMENTKLKDDNEILRGENTNLKQEIDRLNKHIEIREKDWQDMISFFESKRLKAND